VASLAGESRIAFFALSIAVIHITLVTAASMTAIFSGKEVRRKAALKVLKVLSRYESARNPSEEAITSRPEFLKQGSPENERKG
jgi:hypothetical protein